MRDHATPGAGQSATKAHVPFPATFVTSSTRYNNRSRDFPRSCVRFRERSASSNDKYNRIYPSSSERPVPVQTGLNKRRTEEDMERDRLGQWGNGDNVEPSRTSGLERLRNPNLNKVIGLTARSALVL